MTRGRWERKNPSQVYRGERSVKTWWCQSKMSAIKHVLIRIEQRICPFMQIVANLSQEVYRKIIDKQEWKDSGGCWQRGTLDEILNSYLQLSTSLPIQLCSAYFSALTSELAERMTTYLFRMLFLNQLDTKAKQLEALRTVRKLAAVSFCSIQQWSIPI